MWNLNLASITLALLSTVAAMGILIFALCKMASHFITFPFDQKFLPLYKIQILFGKRFMQLEFTPQGEILTMNKRIIFYPTAFLLSGLITLFKSRRQGSFKFHFTQQRKKTEHLLFKEHIEGKK